MRFQKLEIDPAANPAILDTATWDREAAVAAISGAAPGELAVLASALARDARPSTGGGPPTALSRPPAQDASTGGGPQAVSSRPGIAPFLPSATAYEGRLYCLAGLPDGQRVFLRLGLTGPSPLGEPLAMVELPDGCLAIYPTDAAVVHRYIRTIKEDAGPRMLGAVPRLGIGTRMTTAVWPAIWQAMARHGFAANAIQNSVRELNLLPNLLAAAPPETNIAFNFGTIETGYTGSTFEGLWVTGALDGLQHGAPPAFGADADHIQVKRGAGGLARAQALLDASRYYSFYTLDVSDVLNYTALDAGPADADARLAERLPEANARRAIQAFHREAVPGAGYAADQTMFARLVGKHWAALDAVEQLTNYLHRLREGEPFDLELSIDEHPAEVATFDCLTSEDELIFLLVEAQRRNIPLTHIAPNLGVEKGVDYACPDGLSGLADRCGRLARHARAAGAIMDVHSGDDLSATTRRVIGAATKGDVHFKVSPMLQLLFAEALANHHPELFRRWWEDARVYAQRAAADGSVLAVAALRHDAGAGPAPQPSAHDEVFHHFSFPFVGRRNAAGRFLVREEFYRLSPAFYRAYQDCIAGYLGELAHDLFGES